MDYRPKGRMTIKMIMHSLSGRRLCLFCAWVLKTDHQSTRSRNDSTVTPNLSATGYPSPRLPTLYARFLLQNQCAGDELAGGFDSHALLSFLWCQGFPIDLRLGERCTRYENCISLWVNCAWNCAWVGWSWEDRLMFFSLATSNASMSLVCLLCFMVKYFAFT